MENAGYMTEFGCKGDNDCLDASVLLKSMARPTGLVSFRLDDLRFYLVELLANASFRTDLSAPSLVSTAASCWLRQELYSPRITT